MQTKRILDHVPAVYERFLPPFFASEVPVERHATCDECAMCPSSEAPVLAHLSYFAPGSKCCTYHPHLPNYLVGGLLADTTPAGAEGRRRIRAKIAARVGVSPHGVSAPPKYAALYRESSGSFGRTTSMICPYLERDETTCTIWSQRSAVCSTYFCKHVAGAAGRGFWEEFKVYLSLLQRCLAQHVLVECGFDNEVILSPDSREAPLAPQDLDDQPPDPADYARSWGRWVGEEEPFFERAYAIVGELQSGDVERLGGLTLELHRRRVESLHGDMVQPELPKTLLRNPELRVDRSPDGRYVLTGYSAADMRRLRPEVYRLLDAFDGVAPVTDVLSDIREKTGLRLSDGLLIRLYQHRILIDPARLSVIREEPRRRPTVGGP